MLTWSDFDICAYSGQLTGLGTRARRRLLFVPRFPRKASCKSHPVPCEHAIHDRRSAYAAVRMSLIVSMDLRTLLIWRATSRGNYADACHELRMSLQRLLLGFVPSPSALLNLLTRTRGLLSGEFAICYILRDASINPRSLDIYVGSIWFDNFIEEFAASPELCGYQVGYGTTTHAHRHIQTRHVTETLEIWLSNDNLIAIHAAASPSACHAIACSPSSLGTTFVTESSFAIAYPRLTLSRRAIICWDLVAESSSSELDMYDHLESSGFSFEEDPSVWPEFSGGPCSGVSLSPFECLRSLYICPQQGRYFGDSGSLVCFMDTLSVDVAQLKDRSIPPYGIMAVWRLPSNVICDAQCDLSDDLLAPCVIATSIMFQNETFKAASSRCPRLATSTDDTLYLGSRSRARSVTL